MLKVAEIVLILLIPTLAGAGLLRAIRLSKVVAQRSRDRRAGGAVGSRPLERVASDLRRLHRDVQRLEVAPDSTPGRGVRLTAVRSAYADTLLVACRALEVPVASADLSRAPLAEIYRLEAALRDRGLDVSPTALR